MTIRILIRPIFIEAFHLISFFMLKCKHVSDGIYCISLCKAPLALIHSCVYRLALRVFQSVITLEGAAHSRLNKAPVILDVSSRLTAIHAYGSTCLRIAPHACRS